MPAPAVTRWAARDEVDRGLERLAIIPWPGQRRLVGTGRRRRLPGSAQRARQTGRPPPAEAVNRAAGRAHADRLVLAFVMRQRLAGLHLDVADDRDHEGSIRSRRVRVDPDEEDGGEQGQDAAISRKEMSVRCSSGNCAQGRGTPVVCPIRYTRRDHPPAAPGSRTQARAPTCEQGGNSPTKR